jgi:hypothetical protein
VRTNLFQGLFVLIVALGFVTIGAWVATVGRPDVIWTLRLGAPVAMVWIAWKMARLHAEAKRFAVPDQLYELGGKYFEAKGFCFAPTVGTLEDGRGQLAIYFQNNCERPVEAKVKMLPPVRSFRMSRHPLPHVEMNVTCPGGAFGVVRVPFPVPAKYAGRRMSFDVAADVRYPAGRGRRLRSRTGTRVGETRRMRHGYQLLTALVFLAFGLIVHDRPASARLCLPATRPEDGPTDRPLETEILWTPDDHTYGFPVQPRRAA